MPQLVCGWHQAERRGGKGWHPGGPWWRSLRTGPHETQQGKRQGPAPGLGQTQAWTQAGQWVDREQLCKEGHEKLKLSQQHVPAAKKANCILCLLKSMILLTVFKNFLSRIEIAQEYRHYHRLRIPTERFTSLTV